MKTNYMKKRLLVFILLYSCSFHIFGQGVSKIDSLEAALVSAKDSTKVMINIELARSHFNESSDLHLFYARESYKLAKKCKATKSIGLALSEIGRYHYRKGTYDSAYFYINKSIPFYNSRNNKAAVYSQISSIERNRGNYAESIRLLIQSDSLYRLENDTAGIIASNINLGTILGKKSDYSQSIIYFNKAKKLAGKDAAALGNIFNNLSVSYMKLEDLENAEKYALKSIEIRERLSDRFNLAYSYLNYASLLAKKEKNREGIIYFEKALPIFQKFKADKDILSCYNGLGDIYRKLRNYKKSNQYLLQAQELGSRVQNHTAKLSNYENLHLLYRDTKQWEKAYNSLIFYNRLNDSTTNLAKITITKELQTKYEIDKIIKEKKLAEVNSALASAQSESNKNFGVAMTLLGGLILLGGLFLYNRLKVRKKQEILSLKIEEAKSKQHLEHQGRLSELKALQSQMNPHFVYNALNSIQDLILLEDIRNSNKYLGKFSDFIRKVLAFSSKGFISITEEISVLTLYTELEQLRIGDQLELSIKNELSESDSDDYRIPAMFIQPYVENALKHGLMHKKGKKELSILFRKEDMYVICSIEDNGIGRRKANEIQERRKSQHGGFSTNANQERIDLLNTGKERKIKIEIIDKEIDNEAKGTKILLYFPFMN